MDKYQDPEREIKRIWKVEAKKSERKPENICNKYKSWIDSESRTPVNSENTKEDNGAWTEDSERGSQTTRRSPNISDTNTSIRGDKKTDNNNNNNRQCPIYWPTNSLLREDLVK